MTHDIYIVKNIAKTRTNKHKQTVLCFKSKDMHFRWRRENRDRNGSERTASRIGSRVINQECFFNTLNLLVKLKNLKTPDNLEYESNVISIM